MSEEKKSRFKIKWADREVEYYGDEAKAAYDVLIQHVMNTQIQQVAQPSPSSTATSQAPMLPQSQPSIAQNRALDLVSRDSNTPVEQLAQLLEFRAFENFPENVPFIRRHLENDSDAALLVIYAFQVGLQQTQLEVNYVKRVLSELNGYPLPGTRFGEILKDFRRKNWTITSGAGERYRPFCLSADGGLEAARAVLQRLLRGS